MPLVVLTWWALFHTRWGLHLRTTGASTVMAYAAGLSPARIQYLAIFLGGMLAGLGGVQLSLGYTGVWTEGMTAGRGFIAVALVIFAAWNPLRVLAGALLYGGALALQAAPSAAGGAPVSPFLLDMLPLSAHARCAAFPAAGAALRHAGRAEGGVSVLPVTLYPPAPSCWLPCQTEFLSRQEYFS